MINPETLKILCLPWMPMNEKSAFPRRRGIYFAVDENNVIQYIGKAENIKARWQNHEKCRELKKLGTIKVFYLFISDDKLSLIDIEEKFISYYKPPFNIIEPKSPKVDVKKQPMKMVRTTAVDIPDLSEKIKKARYAAKAKGISLSKICIDADMTASNWYLIEKGKTKAISLETLRRIEKALNADFGVKESDFKPINADANQ